MRLLLALSALWAAGCEHPTLEPLDAGLPPLESVPAELATRGLEGPLTAKIDTNAGEMSFHLYDDAEALHFVALARGVQPWQHPKSGRRIERPFYDGLPFGRRVPGFLVQGGDPIGDGTGGPGFFRPRPERRRPHDRPGLLTLLSDDDARIGSQFAITERPAPELDPIGVPIGEIASGLTVLRAIARSPDAVEIRAIKIVRTST